MLPEGREWYLKLDLEGRELFGAKGAGVADNEKGGGQLPRGRPVQVIFIRFG